jgi:hypothetical protein
MKGLSERPAGSEDDVPRLNAILPPTDRDQVDVPTTRGSGRAVSVIASGVFALGAVGAGITWMVRAKPMPVKVENPTSPPTVQTAVVPTAVHSAPPAANEAPSLRLAIRAAPPQAHLLLDDVPLASNPFDGTFGRDGLQHKVRATAPGYSDKVEFVSFDREQASVDISLELAAVQRSAARSVAGPSAVGRGTATDAPDRSPTTPSDTRAPTSPPAPSAKPNDFDLTDPWSPPK